MEEEFEDVVSRGTSAGREIIPDGFPELTFEQSKRDQISTNIYNLEYLNESFDFKARQTIVDNANKSLKAALWVLAGFVVVILFFIFFAKDVSKTAEIVTLIITFFGTMFGYIYAERQIIITSICPSNARETRTSLINQFLDHDFQEHKEHINFKKKISEAEGTESSSMEE